MTGLELCGRLPMAEETLLIEGLSPQISKAANSSHQDMVEETTLQKLPFQISNCHLPEVNW